MLKQTLIPTNKPWHWPVYPSSLLPLRRPAFPCKVLLNILSVATVICLTAFITIQLNVSTQSNPFQPADLCTQSPNPTSCNATVADVVLAAGNPRPSPVQVFRTILHKSLQQLDTASAAATERKEQPALADCIQLMDLPRDRILSSASAVADGAHADARTWMSAVLTNHGTCLEGLDGEAKLALEPHLHALKALASTSLAVLDAISHSSDVDDVVKPVVRFPSWVSHHDRKLLLRMASKLMLWWPRTGVGSTRRCRRR
ncbi:putative Pectinesterase [Cocos nucifera]|nr:putative Pectinesterase [Cocos nucifera]